MVKTAVATALTQKIKIHHGINCCLHSRASLYKIHELGIFIPFVLLMISHFCRKFFLCYQLIFSDFCLWLRWLPWWIRSTSGGISSACACSSPEGRSLAIHVLHLPWNSQFSPVPQRSLQRLPAQVLPANEPSLWWIFFQHKKSKQLLLKWFLLATWNSNT